MLQHKCWVTALAAVLFLICSSAQAQLPDFTGLVKQTGAAVVNVSTTQNPVETESSLPDGIQVPEGTPFDDFLKRFFGNQGHGFQPRPAKSLGSGFIISADGYVLTNHHVVANADEIIVRLKDRRELEAKLIGSDERSDIALLKLGATDLPVVKIGSDRDLQVGEWVVAIGSPFGFENSVTAGIVSAKGRSLPSDSYVPFIQTDVAINPGNSGGPLFNLKGEVVGINSQISTRDGRFMGISFSIPMSVAMNVVDQIKANGEVKRGWLGVQVQDVSRELAESFGMERPHGALVARVLVDSPAQKAGFKVGDVITRFNGQEIETSSALPPIVGMTPVEKSVKVEVIRQRKLVTLTVSIGQLSEDAKAEAVGPAQTDTPSVAVDRLGIRVLDLDPKNLEERFGVSHGVLVQKVDKGAASEAGIQQGDLILRVQNEEIDSAKTLRQVAKTLPAGKSIAVLVQRGRSPVFLAIRISK